MGKRAARKRPIEYSILYTATLCLLAGGAVMVYSASSAESLLDGSGDPSIYLKRYVLMGVIGLALPVRGPGTRGPAALDEDAERPGQAAAARGRCRVPPAAAAARYGHRHR